MASLTLPDTVFIFYFHGINILYLQMFFIGFAWWGIRVGITYMGTPCV